MHRFFRHLLVLWRAETAIAEVRLRVLTRRSMLWVLSGTITLFGLCMLNAAAFLALETVWSPVWAAVAVALGDFLLAVMVAVIALTASQSFQLNSAVELRQAAIDNIEMEFSGLREQFPRLFGVHDQIDTALLALLVPLIRVTVRAIRKSRTDEK